MRAGTLNPAHLACWTRLQRAPSTAPQPLCCAVLLQVKAVQALEIEWDSWAESGPTIALELCCCLSNTLELMTDAYVLSPYGGSSAAGRCGAGGCFDRCSHSSKLR